MLDRAQAEAVIYRVAFASFNFYPEKLIDEPGYTLDEDVDWCLEPLGSAELTAQPDLRRALAEVITDATADRQGFIRRVMGLVTE